MPYDVPLERIEEYLDHCKEGGAMPNFIGLEAFAYLWEQGYVIPDSTFVRIMYTGSRDMIYAIDSDGKLMSVVGDEYDPPSDPAEVLSRQSHPDGWEIEGLWRRKPSE